MEEDDANQIRENEVIAEEGNHSLNLLKDNDGVEKNEENLVKNMCSLLELKNIFTCLLNS